MICREPEQICLQHDTESGSFKTMAIEGQNYAYCGRYYQMFFLKMAKDQKVILLPWTMGSMSEFVSQQLSEVIRSGSCCET